MLKLEDPQLVLLSAAAQRDDRIVIPPAGLDDKAAAKLFRPLLKQKLVEEVPAVNGHPVFRRDRDGDALALRITDDGLTSIGIDSAETEKKQHTAARKRSRKPTSKQKPKGKVKSVPPNTHSMAKGGLRARRADSVSGADRSSNAAPGSKQALLVTMLQKKGANIDAIVRATGWLPHTARAMISGLRKAGFTVELERREDAKSVYRITGRPKRVSRGKKA